MSWAVFIIRLVVVALVLFFVIVMATKQAIYEIKEELNENRGNDYLNQQSDYSNNLKYQNNIENNTNFNQEVFNEQKNANEELNEYIEQINDTNNIGD